MSRRGRILVVEDLPSWRDALSDILDEGGYHVDTAASRVEALNLLRTKTYHLIVLDIRMEETDQNNAEGMDVLAFLEQHGLNDALEVIMLSAHGTKEQMRESFRHYKVADFLQKEDFDDEQFLKQVHDLFVNTIRINLSLEIHWQQVKEPEEVVQWLKLSGKRLKTEPDLQKQVTWELEDLLCRLFYEAESIVVQPLAPGQSGAGVLRVQPFYLSGGGGQPMIVKFGEFQLIGQETHNFKTYVQRFIGGGRNTTQIDTRRTLLLGGVVYSLLGSDDEPLNDFASFYERADLAQITYTLDHLFLGTCGRWYANLSKLKPFDLSQAYRQALALTQERLEQALADRLKSVQGNKRELQFLTLFSDRRFRNPVDAVAEQRLVRSTYECTTHGDLNPGNIFVDKAGDTWLIDFFGTGPGHILRDVAQLDSALRFTLLAEHDATLAERLQMEELLCEAERFSQVSQLAGRLVSDNTKLVKLYETVVHLRTVAQRLVVQNRSDDMSEYSIALLYNALNTIRPYGLPKVQREHALLSACLLAQQLGL